MSESTGPETAPNPPPSKVSRRALILWVTGLCAAAWVITNPATARTIFIFGMMLSLLIFVHEWGHFQFARWSGMKINRFAVGFPPWLWSRRKNGVIYSIGALPIGGVVDIAGMGSERDTVSHLKGESPQVEASADTAAEGKLFQHASLGGRFATLFAGPLMNFLYAMVIFIVIFSMVGTPEPYNTNRIEELYPGSPAVAAGIKPGDNWVGVIAGRDKLRSTDPLTLKNFVRKSEMQTVTLIVQRGAQELRRPFQRLEQPADPADPLKGRNGQALPPTGLAMRLQIKTNYQRLSVAGALQQGWAEVVGMYRDTFGLLFRASTLRLTASDRRDVGGPVKIAEMVGQYTMLGWPALFVLSGVLSVNLAIMNLLPLPALDGGRILFLGYELAAGKPLDPKIENRVHAVGLLALLAFMIFISLRDLLPIVMRMFS